MTDRIQRMKLLGIKQVDMVKILRERGIVVQPPELSNILRGIYTFPKSQKVLNEIDRVLNELE